MRAATFLSILSTLALVARAAPVPSTRNGVAAARYDSRSDSYAVRGYAHADEDDDEDDHSEPRRRFVDARHADENDEDDDDDLVVARRRRSQQKREPTTHKTTHKTTHQAAANITPDSGVKASSKKTGAKGTPICHLKRTGSDSDSDSHGDLIVPPKITIQGQVFSLKKVTATGSNAVGRTTDGVKPAFAKTGRTADLKSEHDNTNAVFAHHPNLVPQSIAFGKDTTACAPGGGRSWMIIDEASGKLLKDTAKFKSASQDEKAELRIKAGELMMAAAIKIAADSLKHPDLNAQNVFFDDQVTKVTGIIDWKDASKGSFSASEETKAKGKFRFT